MSMDMEETDCPINIQIVGKEMANPINEINPVLAHNVVVQCKALGTIYILVYWVMLQSK